MGIGIGVGVGVDRGESESNVDPVGMNTLGSGVKDGVEVRTRLVMCGGK
jgi:hypothetical protein